MALLANTRYNDYYLPMPRRPSKSLPLEAEVFLTLLHAADSLLRPAEEMLKSAGLSHTQYNVLRILRGAQHGNEKAKDNTGLPCGEIAARMITRAASRTRLAWVPTPQGTQTAGA